MQTATENRTIYLHLKVSTSRARDSYGWPLVTLSTDSGKWRTCGGGYDMEGTVVADWLADTHQARLQALVDPLTADIDRENWNTAADGHKFAAGYVPADHPSGLYGCLLSPGRVNLDGGVGIDTIQRLAERIGVSITRDTNSRGRTLGFFASWEGK